MDLLQHQQESEKDNERSDSGVIETAQTSSATLAVASGGNDDADVTMITDITQKLRQVQVLTFLLLSNITCSKTCFEYS